MTASAPLSVMAPVVLTDSAPPTVEGPRSTAPAAVRVKLALTAAEAMDRAPVSLSATLLPDTTVTAPLKLLALSRVMSLAAPAVSVVVVPMDSTPVSVMAPPALALKAPVMEMVPSTRALASTRVRLVAVFTLTAPVKLLPALFSVIALAAALRKVVPPMESAPLWVMPGAVTLRLPVMVSPASRIGEVLTMVRFRMVPADARNRTPPAKLFPGLSRMMELPSGTVKVASSVTCRSPLSVMPPPEVTSNVPLMVDRPPRSMAPASVSTTLLPDTTVTAPLKLLPALARVMSLPAPALRLVMPP